MYIQYVVPTYSSYPDTAITTLVRSFCNPVSLQLHLSIYLYLWNYSRVDFATQMPVPRREAPLSTTQPKFSLLLPLCSTVSSISTHTHTHIIYRQCVTVGPISLCFLLPLPSSISANLFAAQIVSTISCSQYLPRTLSMSFHAPFNLHTSIH